MLSYAFENVHLKCMPGLPLQISKYATDHTDSTQKPTAASANVQ